jgi:hypothetical protein
VVTRNPTRRKSHPNPSKSHVTNKVNRPSNHVSNPHLMERTLGSSIAHVRLLRQMVSRLFGRVSDPLWLVLSLLMWVFGGARRVIGADADRPLLSLVLNCRLRLWTSFGEHCSGTKMSCMRHVTHWSGCSHSHESENAKYYNRAAARRSSSWSGVPYLASLIQDQSNGGLCQSAPATSVRCGKDRLLSPDISSPPGDF